LGRNAFSEGRDRAKVAHEIDAYNAAEKEITLAHKCHYIEITESTRPKRSNKEYLPVRLHPSGKVILLAERLAQEWMELKK